MQHLSHENSLYECVKGLLELHQTKEDDVMFRDTTESIKMQYKIGNKDPTVHQILSDFHKFPADFMVRQLSLASYVQEDTIKKYETTSSSCKCFSRESFRLPCRHIIFIRQQQGICSYTRTNYYGCLPSFFSKLQTLKLYRGSSVPNRRDRTYVVTR